MEICYYPGFYSSLNDDMGPNDDPFSCDAVKLELKMISFKTSKLKFVVFHKENK